MGSLDSIQTRNLTAKGVVGQIYTDSPVAIRLRYKGTGTVTSVTTTTATNIVFVTSDGGTDTYPFAAGLTYNTVAKLVGAINAGASTENVAAGAGTANFEAKALDTLGSYATTSQFVAGAITSAVVDGTTVWDVLGDTSASMYFAYRLTPDRGFFGVSGGTKRVHLKEFVYYATLGGAGANKVQVWDVKGSVETQVYRATSVSATATTTNWVNGNGYHTVEEGHDLVVVLTDAVSLANSTANYLVVTGVVE